MNTGGRAKPPGSLTVGSNVVRIWSCTDPPSARDSEIAPRERVVFVEDGPEDCLRAAVDDIHRPTPSGCPQLDRLVRLRAPYVLPWPLVVGAAERPRASAELIAGLAGRTPREAEHRAAERGRKAAGGDVADWPRRSGALQPRRSTPAAARSRSAF